MYFSTKEKLKYLARLNKLTSIKSSIIPSNHEFAKLQQPHELHLEAICLFTATGFFMDADTYWKDVWCLLPGHQHELDSDGYLIKSTPWFNWHYTPNDLSFEATSEAYTSLLKQITQEKVGNQPVILPLSGGLDSRSLALVLQQLGNSVQAFSYSFSGGFPEHLIAEKVAKVCGFEFKSFKIPKGYLWDCIDDLAIINGCYSEFTHPRQMAVLPQLKQMEGLFCLGHWGDVLFDSGAPEGTTEDAMVDVLLKKMLKPGGLELAIALWQAWGLKGDFKDYLISRIETALEKIKIDHIGAKLRAFKTSQWAHRWTTTNCNVFAAAHPIGLPYYDDRMCQFICTVPEAFLANRRLQIAHLKQHQALANITWQDHRPFNINNYHYNKAPYNLPYRIFNKLQRVFFNTLGNPYIQRNWELQFIGQENDQQLQHYIMDGLFAGLVPQEITKHFYQQFSQHNPVYYSHSVSMLLTLAKWNQQFNKI